MTALVLLSHQSADHVARMVDCWQQLARPARILVAYGGGRAEFDKIRAPKVFVDDPRLRTKDHQRERQSYTAVLRHSVAALANDDWDRFYLAEYDLKPVAADLWQRLEDRMNDEDADLLGHHARRVNDTLHPHYAHHLATPEWGQWVRRISRREDPEVVLSCMGCGQYWRREAVEAVASAGEPWPAYLELHLPTLAHHLGFRVRGMGDQDRFVLTDRGAPNRTVPDAAGAWALHPEKTLWAPEQPQQAPSAREVPAVVHLAHFDPPIHGEAAMAAQLREVAGEWTDLRYIPINARYASSREDLGGLSAGKILFTLRYLAALLRARVATGAKCLILHPAFFPGTFLKESLFVILGRMLGMRVFAWIHMDPERLELSRRPRWFRSWVQWVLERFECFVAVAPSLPAQWPEWIRRHPTTAVANGIDDPNPGGEIAGDGDDPTLRIAYLSAMEAAKGWEELFLAAEILCETHPNLEFHFYGGAAGAETPQSLEARFSGSRFPGRIRWHGPAYDAAKDAAFWTSDLFVFPSHTEQFPLTVLEAMAYGLPVVASRVGAVEDALATPQGGRLIEPGSAEAIVSAVSELLAAPGELRVMGEFNRMRFLKRFEKAEFGRLWHDLMKKWISEPADEQKSIGAKSGGFSKNQ